MWGERMWAERLRGERLRGERMRGERLWAERMRGERLWDGWCSMRGERLWDGWGDGGWQRDRGRRRGRHSVPLASLSLPPPKNTPGQSTHERHDNPTMLCPD